MSIEKDKGCKNGLRCARGSVDDPFINAVWDGLDEFCVDKEACNRSFETDDRLIEFYNFNKTYQMIFNFNFLLDIYKFL